jgi:hypothetical protein
VRVAMLKVKGVENVRVSLNDGLTILDFKPGDTVRLSELRQIIKNNGFVSKEARVVVRGSIKELPGVTVFEVSGTGETFTLAPDPQHAEISGQLMAKPKLTVFEVTGTVDGSAPDRQRLLVSSVR